MNKTTVRGGQSTAMLAGLLLIYNMHPYFFWSGIFLNNYFNAIITIILGSIFFVNRKKMSGSDKCLMAIFGVIILTYPFVSDQNFNVFVSIFPLLFIPFATDEFNKRVFDNSLNIYCVIIGISLIVWVFVMFGVISPLKVIKPFNELKTYNYYVYPLLVNTTHGGIRFHGPFDEPGVVGTISGLLFCCQRNLRSKQSIVLLLSGLCSISLFFFLIAIIYFTYHQILEKRNVKDIVRYIFTAGIALAIVFSSPVLSEKIVSRLVWNAGEGMFVGDNRASTYAWELFNQIKGTRQFWFGIDDKWAFHEKVAYSSSFINIVIMNGVLFFSMILFFYLAYGLKYKVSLAGFLMFFFVVAATIYQRPGIFSPEFIFLWIYLARKDSMYRTMTQKQK